MAGNTRGLEELLAQFQLLGQLAFIPLIQEIAYRLGILRLKAVPIILRGVVEDIAGLFLNEGVPHEGDKVFNFSIFKYSTKRFHRRALSAEFNGVKHPFVIDIAHLFGAGEISGTGIQNEGGQCFAVSAITVAQVTAKIIDCPAGR